MTKLKKFQTRTHDAILQF